MSEEQKWTFFDERQEWPECIVCGVKRRGRAIFGSVKPSVSCALIIQDELGIDLSEYIRARTEARDDCMSEFDAIDAITRKYCSMECFFKHFKLAKKKAKERIYFRANHNHPSQEEYPQDKLRQILIEEESCCRVCGDDRVLELHHIIPQEYGGKTTRGNCVLLCPTCHALTRGQGIIG